MSGLKTACRRRSADPAASLPPSLDILERLARRELVQLQVQPQSPFPADIKDDVLMLALAWDLGITGDALTHDRASQSGFDRLGT